MRIIALCWELGGGFGHLTTLLPVAEAFQKRGDRVVLIARNLWSAGEVFRGAGMTLFQAPFRHGSALQFDKTPTFAYILHNIGFSDPGGLAGLAAGWRSLFETISPDLILADHSPTALLAARGLKIPSMTWGTGFFCPPNESPFPPLISVPPQAADQIKTVERRVLDCANDVLTAWNAAPMKRLADLYHDGPRRFLLTFPELDHYPNRRGEKHRGYWPFGPGEAPAWPEVEGPRVFAYLKPFSRLSDLLQALVELDFPTLVYIDHVDPKLKSRFSCSTLRFADRLVDLRAVGRRASLAITNANTGTVTALLLGGIPQLCIPLQLEQFIVGQAVERMGAGIVLTPEKCLSPDEAIRCVLSEKRYRTAANAFAERHRDFSVERQFEELFAECDAITSTGGAF